MATKTVKVESVLDEKFKIECTSHGRTVIVDQPANAGGTDAGPTPLEYLMVSLAGCIGTIARIMAMQKRIALRGMKITVEGDINVNGLLGKPTDDPVGFKEFRILADIDADMTVEEKEAFIHEVDARCPISFNLLNGAPVKISAV
ncbi:MAG: OsmC family protein [Kiritimatiellales bacterium]|nr:OsmC family protein [Kiritimatiellales bacterium]